MNLNKFIWNNLLKSYSLIQRSTQSRNTTCCDCCCNFCQDKVAIVTGGADGIGLECVRELLRSGVRGCVIGDVGREKECMEALTKEFSPCKILYKHCDVTNRCQFSELFKATREKFCSIHIVLNNAGILNDGEWERQIATNVTACVRGTYMGLEYMSKSKGGPGGAIINVSSILGMQHFAGSPVYVGTKHFLIGFDRSIGDPYHFERTGVKIFTICPGVTLTPMIHNADKFAHKQFESGMGKLLSDALAALPPQGPEAVAKGLITMLNKGRSGSIWVSEGNEFYEVRIPDRRTFRVRCGCSC